MEKITLDQDQQKHVRVLTRLLERKITAFEAAQSLGKSVRTVERLRPKLREHGPAALVHGNTGRAPANKLTAEMRQRIQELARGKYAKFNFTQLTEKLAEDEGIGISIRSTHRICREADITPPRPQERRTQHRKRRPRREQAGEMLQLDGSPHHWLEGRGPELCLVNFIDDATSIRPGREFRLAEDLEGYTRVMWRVVEQYGVPVSIYTDRTAIVAGASQKFKPFRDEPPGPSQFGRMLAELGVAVILANSPQAKGRVERRHGTDQDRLTSELRLAGACTLEHANAVLAKYDRKYGHRFTVAAANSTPAWKSAPANLADIFCIKRERIVARDNTVRYNNQVIDIPPGPQRRSYTGSRVTVHQRYDGTLGVFLNGELIGGQKARSHHAPPLVSPPKRAKRSKSATTIDVIATQITWEALKPSHSLSPPANRPTNSLPH